MDIFDTGVRIRNLRKSHKLTQEELAEEIGVTSHYIYEVEHGLKTMSIYTLANIAEALDASLDYIVYGKVFDANDETHDFSPKDDLSILIETIPLSKMDNVCRTLKGILPYIK